jgi:hypothetical protein
LRSRSPVELPGCNAGHDHDEDGDRDGRGLCERGLGGCEDSGHGATRPPALVAAHVHVGDGVATHHIRSLHAVIVAPGPATGIGVGTDMSNGRTAATIDATRFALIGWSLLGIAQYVIAGTFAGCAVESVGGRGADEGGRGRPLRRW